jgi:hypothetical protein
VLDETTPNEPSFVDLATIDDKPLRLIRDANFGTDSVRSVDRCHRLQSAAPAAPAAGPGLRLPGPALLWRANNPFITSSRFTPDNRPLSDLRALGIVIWHHQNTHVRNPPMR